MSTMLSKAAAEVAVIRERQKAERIAATGSAIHIMDFSELIALASEPAYFEIETSDATCHVYWGGYDYGFDLDQIAQPIHLLELVRHIAEKEWELATGDRLARLIAAVCAYKGWDVYGGTTLPPRATDNAEERAKLTPKLRWSVLKRDGHACRCAACNFGKRDEV